MSCATMTLKSCQCHTPPGQSEHARLSSYDTAPVPVSKGLPLLLAMSCLFNVLPTADTLLVSTSVDAIVVRAGPCSATG